MEDHTSVAHPTLLRPLDFAGEIHRLPVPFGCDLARVAGARHSGLVRHEETVDRSFYNVTACAVDGRSKRLHQSDALDLSSLDKVGHSLNKFADQRKLTRSSGVKIN
jgi:hypothetical protein